MSASDAETTPHPDGVTHRARATFERELYWAAEPEPSEAADAIDVRRSFATVAERFRAEAEQPVPWSDPALTAGSRWRRFVKTRMFRVLRPVSRRYDRMGAELAELGAMLAARVERIERLEDSAKALEWAVGAVRADVADLRGREAAQLGQGAEIPDDFYWLFETRMRGPDHVIDSLRQYEGRARQHLERGGWGEGPLWLDVGCGRGEFAQLLIQWGWRVKGVDISADAVDACIEQGLDAVHADALSFLQSYTGEPPAAVSGIQLIEHLPREVWLPFIRAAHHVLRDGGALLLETINPLNVRALAEYFFADLSHSWPAQPYTLQVMTETVGFERSDLEWLNPDGEDRPQDYALWAVK
jgi:SAM-dependent methyltransferase